MIKCSGRDRIAYSLLLLFTLKRYIIEFTSFLYRLPPYKTTPRNRLVFLSRTPDVDAGDNIGYSYAHAHIAQIIIQENITSMSLTILFLIKNGSFRINAKLAKEELMCF